MKKIYPYLLILALLPALCACSLTRAPAGTPPAQQTEQPAQQTEQPAQQTERPTGQEEAAPMEVTKEYLIEHSTLTEADFEGVDFDDFAAHCGLSLELLEEYAPELLLGLYKAELAAEPTVDYTPLYEAAEGRVGEDELPEVETLLWEYHEGTYNDCMVVDRAKGAVYYDIGYFLDACGESRRVADFGEEDAAFLLETLRESGIASWQNEYEGTSEGTTGHFSWAVCLKLSDGRSFLYRGGGVMDSGTPDTLRPMMKALIERFAA